MRNGESWQIDPETRDYEQEDGAPVIDLTLKMPIYFRTRAQRTRWLYAPNTRYGSDFWQIRTKQNANSPALMQGVQERCLQPILEDGRALEITVTPSAMARQGIALDVKAVDSSGKEQELKALTPILGGG